VSVQPAALAVLGVPPEPRVPVKRVRVEIERLKVGAKGSVYEIRMDVQGVTQENAARALDALDRELRERFGVETVYGTATAEGIDLIIRGSPFAWAALLAALPLILGLLGIALVGVSVWQIVGTVPGWVWWAAGVGIALFLFGPRIGDWIAEKVAKERPAER
jgi:hypothetical protein